MKKFNKIIMLLVGMIAILACVGCSNKEPKQVTKTNNTSLEVTVTDVEGNPVNGVIFETLDKKDCLITDENGKISLVSAAKISVKEYPSNYILLENMFEVNESKVLEIFDAATTCQFIKVTDESGKPVVGAKLEIINSNSCSTTDSNGVCSFEISNSNDIINYPIKVVEAPSEYIITEDVYTFSKTSSPEVILKKV